MNNAIVNQESEEPWLTLVQSATAFCVSAPSVWNSLSDHRKQAELLSTFKRLKTDPFHTAYKEQNV